MANSGLINEQKLIDYINDNSFYSFNQNIKDFLLFIFGIHFDNSAFKAYKPNLGQIKPDMVIEYKGIKKFISVKKGSGNSIHQENFDVFVDFLIKEGFNQSTINNLKLFHYGDGTIDDSGVVRLSATECKKKYQNEINQLNFEFNKPVNLIKMLDRFLFIGNLSTSVPVDAVYHGTIESGVWANKTELVNYFLSKRFKSRSIHFASLTYQVWGRNNNYTAVHPERRYIMQVKWGKILNDISNIIKSRGM